MTRNLTRRRFLAITAAACAATRVTAATPVALWRGAALGTVAEVRLLGIEDPDAIFAEIEAELDRIDRLFSLYRSDSALVRLNQDGALASPDPDFLDLLSLARSVHRASEGAFDPTVQPLFSLHAEAFAAGHAASVEAVQETLARVGFEHVIFDASNVRFTRTGMAMSFNGIAQGFATDSIVSRLRALGLHDVLVNAGEVAGLGVGPGGKGWSVRLPSSVVRLTNEAVATSRAGGTLVDPMHAVGHIFDPSGGQKLRDSSVSVIHDSAAVADAISTASIVMNNKLLKSFDNFGAKILL